MTEFQTPDSDSEQDQFVGSTMGEPSTMQQAMAEIARLQAQVHGASTPKRPRPILPDPEPYTGEDHSLYPQFESKLRAKLRVDKEALGGVYERLWYAFGRLKDKAAQRLHPWMEVHGNGEALAEEIIERFFQQMRFHFADIHRKVKANERLHYLRQGNREFNEYLGEFEQVLLEAGGDSWGDDVKCGFLTNGLNMEMRQALVSLQPAEQYVEYCRQLQKIADRLATLQRIQRGRKGTKGRQSATQPRYPTASPTPPNIASSPGQNNADAMDWAPAGAELNSVQRRAKWVSTEEIEKRRKENRCMRCGANGHYKYRCPHRAARPPPAKVATVQPRGPELDPSSKPEDTESEKE
jgi:Retrotransposon gag protein